MQTIKTHEIKSLIETANGRFFSAVFVKANGSDRHINCRTGVSRYVTGAGRKYDPSQYGLVSVWDAQIRDYRSLPLDRIKSIQVDGKLYVVCN